MQRLGIVLAMVAAFAVAAAGFAAPASAAKVSATKLEKSTKKAQKKAKATCKKAGKVNRSNKASKKAKGKAKSACKKAKKNSKRLTKKLKTYNQQFFDVCKRGCKYKTVQAGANAAGVWQLKNKKRSATVRVQPGIYNEGVLLRGKIEGRKYDNLTIMGVKKDKSPATTRAGAMKVILEGKDAKTIVKGNSPTWSGPSATNPDGDPAVTPAQNAIDAEDIDGIKFKNMWARNYLNNTFFVHASNVPEDNSHCSGFVMDNLVSSDTRSYGMFSRNCFGGKFLNSEGWNHGDSAFYVGETPCDDPNWTNKGPNPGPCQADPDWTIIKNVDSHQGSLGYSGTNSKYVKIQDSRFYNNGAGLVPNTLDSEKFEPSGWLIFENNDIFWNNLNYYSTGSPIETAIGNGNPTGIGIMLYGTDGVVMKNNRIFGNEQWGAAGFSGPDLFGVNDGDDAKNMNNQYIDNEMGLGGKDPNGNYDFFTDNSGGGNCWSDNSAGSTFAPGNGSVPVSTIYPACPRATVFNDNVPSIDFGAGLQVNPAYLDPQEPWRDLTTIFGLAEVRPSELQECSWKTSSVHMASYTADNGKTYTPVRTDPVSAQACTDLENRPSPYNP
ncbi:MAG: hypothetical protein ACSLFD_01480 [Solirubrobacterales bacterium]